MFITLVGTKLVGGFDLSLEYIYVNYVDYAVGANGTEPQRIIVEYLGPE